MKKLMITLGVLIGLLILCLFSYNQLKKYDSLVKTLDVDSSLVTSLYNLANPSEDITLLKQLYQDAPLNNQYSLAIAAKNYLEMHLGNRIFIIPEEELLESLLQTTGQQSVPLTDITLYTITSDNNFYCGFTYNQEAHQYEIMTECTPNQNEIIKRRVTKATQATDQISIQEKVIYLYNDVHLNFNRLYVYSDINQEKMLGYLENVSPHLVSINSYLHEASTYEYIFKKVDDHYVFSHINRLD